MQIYRLPALSDNYIFLLHDPKRQVAAVVDPAEAEPVLIMLQNLGATLTAIFNTHHHGDHVGGNRTLLQHFPQTVVYGGAVDQGRIPGQQVFLQGGDRLSFADRHATVLFVPGHTRAHIAYYFESSASDEPGELFCGDTLFAGGCGRLFEGTPGQMVQSLSQVRSLPDNTRIWCAHEYTLNNLRFAHSIEPDNEALTQRLATVQQQRQQQEPTVPSWLGIEKRTNPFLRWDISSIQTAMQTADPVQSFTRLRGKKDQW
ncbi:MAG: hydroxyacylglutathione hydrolase [Kaiparowitsia implicata GSE-PSE-MK54-09C]|jgi:hydroxyacylglutathione hydrolase|nr:hydroxyacylglutathione hydrolase [Kaiparowitsia implicata GSE-PSE-MK54-09C]